jgi:protein-tyrosine phosphatase
MIDIHSHILPGLDDGAKSVEETLKMVSQLQEAGFNTLLATPHVIEGKDFLSPEEILAATEQVRERVSEAGISVEILPGAENYIFPETAKWAREGRLLTLGNTGKYLLVELPMLQIPQYTDRVFFELQINGMTPVLAHPERYRGLVEEPERLIDWANKGILFQVDLRSLSGNYGPEARGLAEIMLHSNLIHFIGSDAHHVSRRESTYAEAHQMVKEIVGEIRFQEVTLTNPQAILEGKAIQGDRNYVLNKSYVKRKKSRFWSFFRI